MKLKYTYIFFICTLIMLLFQSYNSGTTIGSTLTNCTTCHSGSNGSTTIDSIAVYDNTMTPVTQYVAGQQYRLVLIGSHSITLNNCGFQVTHNGKGTFGTAPTNTAKTGNLWVHSTKYPGLLGSTGKFIDSINWTAPAAGSGTVTLNAYLNATNSNNQDVGDQVSALYTKTLTEAAPNVAGVVVTMSPPNSSFCPGTSKTFTATPTNGGSAPTYQWKLNGTNVGTGGTTYTTSTLNTNDSVWCVMTSNLSGVTGNPATSNKIKVTVLTPYVNNVTITANKTTVCAGDTVIFTATPNAGATTPFYRWYLNAGATQIGSGASFTKIGFAVGDSIHCRLTVSNACATPNPDTSNYIKMTVNTSPVITGNVNQQICAGDSSLATNWTSTLSGTNYTWTNNNPSIGLPASGTGQIGKFKTINNSQFPANATITVYSYGSGCNGAPVTFSYTIKPLPKVKKPTVPTYCSGTNGLISFTTIPPIGPNAFWNNDNTSTGIPSSGSGSSINFTATNMTAADSIISNITVRDSLNGCIGPDSTFKVIVYRLPTVNQPANITICHNDTTGAINFSSSQSGATFSWTNSDPTIGLNASGSGNIPNFSGINTGTSPKVATIEVTASYKTCIGPKTSFFITVNNPSPADVNIFTKDSVVCPGGYCQFKAFPTNGGSAPTYQWFRNGTLISGANKDTVSIFNIADNDQVKCVLTSNSNCVTSPTNTSRIVTLKTISKVIPTVVISAVSDTICNGSPITINTTISNGGLAPTYQWYLNGSAVTGSTSDVYLSSSLHMNDKITCEMTSSLGCANPTKAMSNEIKFKVFPVVNTQINLTANKTKICSDDLVTFTATYSGQGANPAIKWTFNGQDMGTNPSFVTLPVNSNTDVVSINVTSSEICARPSKSFSASKSIDTVLQGPVVDVIPNTYRAFCEGDSIIVKAFNGQPNYIYLWSNGKTTDSFWSKSTQSYTLKVTEPGNVCPRYYGPLTAHMNPLPFKPEISAQDGIVRSTFSDSYQWQLNKLDIVGADTQIYKIAINGLYRVKVRNAAGCVNYSDELMVYPLSISNGKMNAEIMVYPNPSNGIFTIKSEGRKIQEIVIYDLMGKSIYKDNAVEYTKQIEANDLPKGNYLLWIKTDKDAYQQKIEIK